MISTKKRICVLFAIMILVSPLLAGCIGGGGDSDDKKPFSGNIESLLLADSDLPEQFREYAERMSMPADEIFPDDELPDDLGFQEAHALTAMFFDDNFNFGILAQLVMRLDIEKMETAMDEYREAQEEDYEGEISSVNFGTIGDETYGLKVSDPEMGMDMYELVFIKDDIMVIFIVSGVDNPESLIKELAKKVEGKI